ncbi:hypothetical protein C2845_PM03G31480 [Panicum miliaceum]|uniref:DUF7597 domain-containing protein n=1 Tax=Panicum miliaceum TaxID=4540 RepID=A0A3L6T797_PANMI|nr:hypothetical protein C2845_PM03G31480 [Panicum miliaceum]
MKPTLQNSNPTSFSDSSHGDSHDRQEINPEVEEGVQFQIPCDRVFGTIKRALNINDKSPSKAFQNEAPLDAINGLSSIHAWARATMSESAKNGGPNRRERVTVCFSGAPSRRHEEYAIAVTEEILTPAQRLAFMHEVREYISVVARRQVVSFIPHPHGIGIYGFQSSCDKDNLVYNSPHWIGNRSFSLVNHDEAMNCRRSVFARVGWILLVGYPLDYKESHFIHQACTPIGKVLQWHSNDTSKARILVKVLIENVAAVPWVIKLKSGRALDGEGRAWLIIDDDEDNFPNNEDNNNGGNGNNEAIFVANLANLHQQQQGFAPAN